MPTLNNISTDFIKINDEYVKFYATTNTGLPELLKNTGALIVVQDNDSIGELDNYLRSLYISKNFVASGHGFIEDSVRKYYEYYGEKVDSANRRLTVELSSLQKGIDANTQNFDNFVKTNGGNISNTNINAYIQGSFNTFTLKSSYILNILKPYDYKDIEIYNVSSYISYFYNVNDKANSYISYATNINNVNFNDKNEKHTLEYDIPRGSSISHINISFNTINNGCGGYKESDKENVATEYLEDMLSEESLFTMNYNINNVNNSSADTKIIKDNNDADYVHNNTYITAYKIGTVEFKRYPNLQNVNYISYENAIPSEQITLSYINLNIFDVIKYKLVDDNLNVIKYNDINSNNARIYNNLNNRANSSILCDNISNDRHYYLYFGVPINYEIRRISILRKQKHNLSDSYYEYNVTGDVFELEKNSNDKITYNYKTHSNYYCECKYYFLSNGIFKDDIVNIELYNIELYLINKEKIINNYNINITDTMCQTQTTNYFVQNSEYNSTHWLDPNDLAYIRQTP